MRMWMVDAHYLCRQHLLGEHKELHMLAGHLRLKKKLDGYVDVNALELMSLRIRHAEIADEMLHRGYNHQSPFPVKTHAQLNEMMEYLADRIKHAEVNTHESFEELKRRCKRCRERIYGT